MFQWNSQEIKLCVASSVISACLTHKVIHFHNNKRNHIDKWHSRGYYVDSSNRRAVIPSVLVIKPCVWFHWITVEKSQAGMTDKTGIYICYLRDILFQFVMLDMSEVEVLVYYALETLSRKQWEMQKTVMQMHRVMEWQNGQIQIILLVVSLWSAITSWNWIL